MKVSLNNSFKEPVTSTDALVSNNNSFKIIQAQFNKIIVSAQSFEEKVESLKNALPLSARVKLLDQFKALEKLQEDSMKNASSIPPYISKIILKHYQNAISLLQTSLK